MVATYEFNNKIEFETSTENQKVMHFFIADTHYGDEGLRRFFKRPFESTNKMDKFITKLITDIIRIKYDMDNIQSLNNKDCKIKNILWILGDFAHDNATVEFVKEKVAELKFDKTISEINLILGNHDKLTKDDYLDAGFSKVFSSAFFDVELSEGNTNIRGAETIKGITLIHDPACYNLFIKNEVLLHGHVHFGKMSCIDPSLQFLIDENEKIINTSIEPILQEFSNTGLSDNEVLDDDGHIISYMDVEKLDLQDENNFDCYISYITGVLFKDATRFLWICK